jgi:DNA-binding SARP family transcriptional activator
MLLKLNLLPEISAELADLMIGSNEAGKLLERLYQRQLLITRTEAGGSYFQLHDLFREFLHTRLEQRFSQAELASLREQATNVLRRAGRTDDAIAVALQAGAASLARDLILERAEAVLAEGRRATFIDWCSRLPDDALDGWLCYWLGVAHIPDDAGAERWLSQAWALFEAAGDRRGLSLTVSRVVLVKTSSWRTYEGLSAWTRRAMALLEAGLPPLEGAEDLLVRIGMLRALTFADDYYRESAAGLQLTEELLARIADRRPHDPAGLRLLASESLIELSVVTMEAEIFEKAVDSVVDDLADPAVQPWDLGLWLVAFGARRGRYFSYSRRDFPYASAEEALRAAIAIGEREALRNVEFGGLYHLQMQMKFRNDFREFGRVVDRLAEIADSRFTTQVAVVADCQAALHARQGDFAQAYRDCERFMAAIEAANEPMLERWPHYITWYQVLLADRKPQQAIGLLAGILPKIDGGARRRTELCIHAAEVLAAKWNGDPRYGELLGDFVTKLRDAKWPTVLLNLPELFAELLADALERQVAVDFCRSIIAERRLLPPSDRPGSWPWPLKVHVLGGFRLERDGAPLDLGAKPPSRALDILRALAVSKDAACSLEMLQDWLWPDLDGAQAKAACEQALHRLRKLLGQADLLVQREGRLSLAGEYVWVDVVSWEDRLRSALRSAGRAAEPQLESLFEEFPGPLLLNERVASWLLPATERVRREFVELARRVGKQREADGNLEGACAAYVRALDLYPDSEALYERLIGARLAQGDATAAISDYARYERTIKATDGLPSPAIGALVKPLLGAGKQPRRASDT